jgi:hypothetical protein
MSLVEALKAQIANAFATVEHPGDLRLRGSDEGEEPFLIEREFAGKSDWTKLDPRFLDQAPDGFGSALSFFSDEAFRNYLPAFLTDDIAGLLERQDPVFHLTHGLTDETIPQRINPRRYGEQTWFDEARHKFAKFGKPEAAAVVAYLQYKQRLDEFDRERIEQALRNYWLERAN